MPGEKRSELNARNAANYKPSRPAPDGSFAFFGVDWYALEKPETAEWSQHKNQLGIVHRARMSDRERELVFGESLATLLRLP